MYTRDGMGIITVLPKTTRRRMSRMMAAITRTAEEITKIAPDIGDAAKQVKKTADSVSSSLRLISIGIFAVCGIGALYLLSKFFALPRDEVKGKHIVGGIPWENFLS